MRWYVIRQTNKLCVSRSHLWLQKGLRMTTCYLSTYLWRWWKKSPTGQNEVSALGHLNDLSLLDELTDSSTSAGTVDLQAVHNSVDGDELHLQIISSFFTTNLRNLSKQLVVIGLLEVHLVIDGISGLSLAPLLQITSIWDEYAPSFRWQTRARLETSSINIYQINHSIIHPTYHVVIK